MSVNNSSLNIDFTNNYLFDSNVWRGVGSFLEPTETGPVAYELARRPGNEEANLSDAENISLGAHPWFHRKRILDGLYQAGVTDPQGANLPHHFFISRRDGKNPYEETLKFTSEWYLGSTSGFRSRVVIALATCCILAPLRWLISKIFSSYLSMEASLLADRQKGVKGEKALQQYLKDTQEARDQKERQFGIWNIELKQCLLAIQDFNERTAETYFEEIYGTLNSAAYQDRCNQGMPIKIEHYIDQQRNDFESYHLIIHVRNEKTGTADRLYIVYNAKNKSWGLANKKPLHDLVKDWTDHIGEHDIKLYPGILKLDGKNIASYPFYEKFRDFVKTGRSGDWVINFHQ